MGLPLSTLLRQSKFHPMAYAMVVVGETGGDLHLAFRRLGEYFQHRYEWKQKLVGALIYPLLVAGVMGVVTLFVLYGILPRFELMYVNLGFELPSTTRKMFSFTAWIRTHLPWLFGSFMGLAGLLFIMRGMIHSRYPQVASFILSLPVIARIWRLWLSYRLADAIAVLTGSGVPLLNTLETAAQIARFSLEQTIIASVKDRILAGATLTEALKLEASFEPMFVHAIYAAEASGSLAEICGFAAKEFETDLQRMTQRLVQLVEPALLMGIGATIGFVILAVVMPMLEMVQSI